MREIADRGETRGQSLWRFDSLNVLYQTIGMRRVTLCFLLRPITYASFILYSQLLMRREFDRSVFKTNDHVPTVPPASFDRRTTSKFTVVSTKRRAVRFRTRCNDSYTIVG